MTINHKGRIKKNERIWMKNIVDVDTEKEISMLRLNSYLMLRQGRKDFNRNHEESIEHEDLILFLMSYNMNEKKAVNLAEYFYQVYYPSTFNECSLCKKKIIDLDEWCLCTDSYKKGNCNGLCEDWK